MARKKEKKELEKKNWTARFSVRGTVKINDYTYFMDQRSNKSEYIYNRLNLGVYCGPDFGTTYVTAIGGYYSKGESVISVHGKDENGRDDFSNQYKISFEDRNDSTVLSEIGDSCFRTVSIEKDVRGNLAQVRFLSEYDMISYLKEHLEDGMCVAISGTIRWQEYNGSITPQKSIDRVILVENDLEKYHANFTQTMLIDKDSFGEFDKDKGVNYIDAYVLEWFKEFHGHNLVDAEHKNGRFVPLRATFEYRPMANKEQAIKAIKKMFKPKKGVMQVTFEGDLVSSGAVIQTTVDDLPDDIKELIDLGLYTEEDALAKCADNGSRENRMVIVKPQIKRVLQDDGETKVPIIQIFPDAYDDDDLDLDFLTPVEDDDDGFMDLNDSDADGIPFDEDDDEFDFLKDL